MRDRREQGGSQPIGFDRALGAVDILHQIDALDRERALIDQGIEQTALIGREQRAGLVAVNADNADGAAPRSHGQEQALGARPSDRSPTPNWRPRYRLHPAYPRVGSRP